MAVRIHGTYGSWSLPQGVSILGRGTGSDVRIDDPRLSRSHARFTVTGHQVRVEELGSRNGMLVDGQRIVGGTDLHHGQVVVCGPVVLMVSIDQTQPHPINAEGRQDSSTRRATGRGDTEAMLAAVSAAEPPSTGGRGIDPAILAAVSSSEIPAQGARQSALQPAQMPSRMTSPLQPGRPEPPPPRASRRSPSTSSSLEAPSFTATASGALELPTPTSAQVSDRIIAGLVDGLAGLCSSAGGLLVAVLAVATALTVAGATVQEGLPRLAPGASAGFAAICTALLHPAGFLAGLSEVPTAAAGQPAAAVIVVLGSALAAMAAMAGPLLVLVVPTVTHGGPAMHRRRGLAILRCADGAAPSYGQAMLRWSLALLLWPLAIAPLLMRRRTLHDIICDCVVRRVR